jgi:hypothetical protein
VQGRQTYVNREVAPSPELNYLDAKGGEGYVNRNQGRGDVTTLTDEQILQMTNPGMEMAQMGQRLGMTSLMDHGAVSALTKVFDAKAFIVQYVDRLEHSLDALGRILFLLYWKPKDFADMFGDDDISILENKIVGVFQSFGDLELELQQNVGSKMR